MKRKTLKFMACATMMTLMLSVTACGGSDDGASSSNTDSAAVEDAADTGDAAEPETDADKAETGAEDADKAETGADEADAGAEDADETDADTAEDTNAGDEDSYDTLEDAFADPEVKAAMDEQFASMDLDGMEFTYEVKGNDFIANYKVLDTVIDDPDDFAEQMDPVMDQLGGVFSLIPQAFDEAIGQEGATSVVVRFLDADDTLLIERSYKAE